MPHLAPTAELAERALLPDDPAQALALATLLFEQGPPRMFNHSRGLWGYTGVAADGALLTVQSTGIGGASAAVVLAELAALGLRRAIRVGRAWPLASLPAEPLVAVRVLARDGTSRALGAPAELAPDPTLAAALAQASPSHGTLVSADLIEPDPCWLTDGAVAFDLESAAVLATARRHNVAAAVLVAADEPHRPITDADRGIDDGEAHELRARRTAERLGRAALSALAALAVDEA